jgi:hypothetical protein
MPASKNSRVTPHGVLAGSRIIFHGMAINMKTIKLPVLMAAMTLVQGCALVLLGGVAAGAAYRKSTVR